MRRRHPDPAGPARRQARFEDIFAAHHGQVLRYCRRRAASPAHTEDATSEVFLAAWRRLEDVPLDALPWLYLTARGVLANQARTQRRSERLAERLAHERPEGFDAPAADLDLLEALARLGERDREALLLVAWEGLDHRQAAAAMGISRAAFSGRYLRARRRLARLHSGSDAPDPHDACAAPQPMEGLD